MNDKERADEKARQEFQELTLTPYEQLSMDATEEVLNFASDIFNYVINELEGGFWRTRLEALTPDQRKLLFIALADAFNDSTEN